MVFIHPGNWYALSVLLQRMADNAAVKYFIYLSNNY